MPIVKKAKVLLPEGIDMSKWATIACDQYNASSRYWNKLEKFVGDAPSTLKITFPEIFLPPNGGAVDTDKINQIHNNMNAYISQNIFREIDNLILVERQVGEEIRVGIILQIDLDSYDWNRVRVPIRATEDTLIERLPVRVDIRKDAPIETPHVILLIDDDKKEIIEPLYNSRQNLKKLYDFDLNMGGGNIKGYEIENSSEVLEKINALLDPEIQTKKYGQDAGILFAVGDGNHSIATAKLIWEELKPTLSKEERKNHPARYFLAEVVNLYGGGMEFEPIHRVIFNAGKGFIDGLKNTLSGEGKIKFLTRDKEEEISVPALHSEAIKAIQEYIEYAATVDKSLKVEYIHNENHLKEVLEECGGVGIVMPRFPQEELFNYVVNVGNLPKKAFSIGEPEHKRYYLECKYII